MRWFNGTDWTYQYQAPTQQFAPPPPAERRITIHYGFALLAFFSLCGTLLFAIPWIAAGDEPHGELAGTLGVLWLLWGGMWTLIWSAFAIHHTLQGRHN